MPSDPTEQIRSSPEIIDASSGGMTAIDSCSPKTRPRKARLTYPSLKTCVVCSTPFPCNNATQLRRNKVCSRDCSNRLIGLANAGKKRPDPICMKCGKPFRPKGRPAKALAKYRYCGVGCATAARMEDPATVERLRTMSSAGRAAWTEESLSSYREKMSGDNNPAWKGGVTIFKTHGNYVGVRYVRCPDEFLSMARKDGYVMEHRLFVARAMGRCLTRAEVVHHVDHDPTNNVLTNLQLFASNRDHKLYEHHGSPLPIWPPSNPSNTGASFGA